jgi:hypothetical protein
MGPCSPFYLAVLYSNVAALACTTPGMGGRGQTAGTHLCLGDTATGMGMGTLCSGPCIYHPYVIYGRSSCNNKNQKARWRNCCRVRCCRAQRTFKPIIPACMHIWIIFPSPILIKAEKFVFTVEECCMV